MQKQRIGIISEFSKDSLNFGNVLQAYALPKAIKNIYPEAVCQQLLIAPSYDNILRTKKLTLKEFFLKGYNKFRRIVKGHGNQHFLGDRKSAFQEFVSLIPQTEQLFNYSQISKFDDKYDALVVGSDVVWRQMPKVIHRIKFLDFPFSGKRVSYAASFGTDWIPEENINDVVRCLSRFDTISVREKSSIQLLESIGIYGAKHALDSTLLLEQKEWEKIEVKPHGLPDGIRYVFVYLLGVDESQHVQITRLCQEEMLNIVTIPYASGEYNCKDDKFGDIQIMECSPRNFIWLIRHAEYIITDSFHGLAFSTIFQKRFVVTKRAGSNLENRLVDYLNTIEEDEKIVDFSEMKSFDWLSWNYEKINQRLAIKRKESYDYLKTALGIQNEV